MSRHIGSISLCDLVEKTFAAIAFVAAAVVICAGTAAMCFPGLVA